MFKRSPSLTEQVKSHLKQRIINAEFDGGRMPPEMELARELKVSRNTVRDALGRLETEGVILRRQGAGTFINQVGQLVKNRLEEIIPYEALIRESGYTPTVRLLSAQQKQVPAEVTTHLHLSPDEELLIVQKLFLADDKPVILTLTYIPPDIIKQPYTQDDCRLPVYEFIPQFCRQEFAYYLSEIVPLIATSWLAERLDLPEEGGALLTFEETGYNQDNQPIVRACSHFRHDLLRLRLIRRLAR